MITCQAEPNAAPIKKEEIITQTTTGGFMLRPIVVSVLFALPLPAQAADLMLSDLKAQGGVQLSAEELKPLLTDAKVVSYHEESTRRWKNDADGKFVASGDARRHISTSGKSRTAQGTWHVGDNGTYCVTLEWPRSTESWCRYIFRVGDKYYGVKSIADGTSKAFEFEFSK
jgi:hypothetical protein